MPKYKLLYYETANSLLNQLGLFDCTFYNMDTFGNSRANTPVDTWRYFNVYNTSIRRRRRRIDVL